MTCQRCSGLSGDQAVAVIRSEILNLKVCSRCAKEAADLGLQIEPLEYALSPARSAREKAAA